MDTRRDPLVTSVLDFIRRHRLAEPGERVLVGVSGGLDSLVLAEVLLRAGYPIGIAHVNFKLRGKASDSDARFVEEWAVRKLLPFHLLEAPAKPYAKTHRKSLQVAAREIRYRYFETLRKEAGYDRIAVAHHRDDAIETFFMHLLRGAGLRGLSSIPVRQGAVIRPLLGVSRKDIERYAKRKKLKWREDSSNKEEKYERNRLRQHLLPQLKRHAPAGLDGIERSLEHLRFAREVFEAAIAGFRKRHFSTLPDGTRYLSLPLLRKHPFGPALLHELLLGTGFEPGEPEKVLKTTRTGSRFRTGAGHLAVDRERLLLLPFEVTTETEWILGTHTRRIRLPAGILDISRKTYLPGDRIPSGTKEHWLDAAGLRFPLQIRHWKAGDRFRPLGMQGSRKLSDYLTDRKFSAREKEKVLVVLSEGRIVCILGERISHDHRITTTTRKILRLQWKTPEHP
jgi:tRNA(Ile)-lysidine synthase